MLAQFANLGHAPGVFSLLLVITAFIAFVASNALLSSVDDGERGTPESRWNTRAQMHESTQDRQDYKAKIAARRAEQELERASIAAGIATEGRQEAEPASIHPPSVASPELESHHPHTETPPADSPEHSSDEALGSGPG